AHERINSYRGEAPERTNTRPREFQCVRPSRFFNWQIHLHSLSRRMRQIVCCERKRFAQLSVENLECGGQFALDTGARRRFFQSWKMWNRIAERDPDRRARQREPAFL